MLPWCMLISALIGLAVAQDTCPEVSFLQSDSRLRRSLPNLLHNTEMAAAADRECRLPSNFGELVSVSDTDPVNANSLESLWRAFIRVQSRDGRISELGRGTGRYLLFDAIHRNQGVGSLLNGLELALFLAMYSERALLLHWPGFTDAVQPRYVDWRVNSADRAEAVAAASHSHLFQAWHSANRTRMDLDYDLLEALHKVTPGVVRFAGNAGVFAINASSWNLSRLGLPAGVTLRTLFQRRVPAPLVGTHDVRTGCALHFLLSPRKQLSAAVARILEEAPSVLGVQLRAGDVWASFSSDSSKNSKDRRPVLHNPNWGLRTPERATESILECARQLCHQRFPELAGGDGCGVQFESDSSVAREAALAWKRPGLKVFVPKFSPQHSRNGKYIQSLASMVALASHTVVLGTTGGFAFQAQELGPSVIGPQGFSLGFECFLSTAARDHRHSSADSGVPQCNLSQLATPAAQVCLQCSYWCRRYSNSCPVDIATYCASKRWPDWASREAGEAVR